MNHTEEFVSISRNNLPSLAGTLFAPASKTIKGAILLAPATGIKRQYYGYFCRHLAEHGYAVLSFDFDGIGESLTGSVEACTASLQSWGEIDLPAALDTLIQRYPDIPCHLIGNSAGGQLTGLMHNANHLASVLSFGSSSGQLSNFAPWFKLQAHFFMNMLIPLSNLVFGHTKSQWFGMGEPLPKKVAAEWRWWCNHAGYTETAFGKTIHQHLYHELDTPMLWLYASDDGIANSTNVDDMIRVFSNSQSQKRLLKPQDFQLKEIGHMGFFKAKNKVLWPIALAWLEQHTY